MRTGRLESRWAGGAISLVLLAGLLASGCSQAPPSSQTLIQRAAAAMTRYSYRMTGTSRVGITTVTFSVEALATGDFSGSVDTAVPPSPTLVTQVVAVGSRVYVLSPNSLSGLGITSLPGNLNPATTWVLQPSDVASRYRASVAPFIGPGLALTLRRGIKGRLPVRAVAVGGEPAWLVSEVAAGSSLQLYIAKGSYQLLRLVVRGPQLISLRYDEFGRISAVDPPPPAQVYVPPTPAPGA